jgi:hypothetical protein
MIRIDQCPGDITKVEVERSRRPPIKKFTMKWSVRQILRVTSLTIII